MEERTYVTAGTEKTEGIAPTVQHATVPPDQEGQQRKIVIGIIVAVVVLLILTIGGVWLLALPSTDTARIRDIFIIFLALQSLVIGATLIILIIQLARLINLLQNEIKPILDSTNETVSNLRGTATFLSDNLSEPVIKINEYAAALSQLFSTIGVVRRRPKE